MATSALPRLRSRRAQPAAPVAGGHPRPWRLLLLGCLVLAALAHYLPAGPTYDPWAWITWGREITEWDLDTRTGPSWKPLPVLFTRTSARATPGGLLAAICLGAGERHPAARRRDAFLLGAAAGLLRPEL